MSLVLTPLVQNTALPGAVASQFMAPTGKAVLVSHAVFTNTTAGTLTVTAYLVPNGGSPATANKVLDAYSLTAHTAYASPELAGSILNAGDSLQCFCSGAGGVNLNASGVLQS
jgi:hypothetical protein